MIVGNLQVDTVEKTQEWVNRFEINDTKSISIKIKHD